MAYHAKLAASAASRWFACPGSVRASEGHRNETSRAAAEGTVAHDLAALCLDNDLTPRAGRATEAGFEIEIDQEMVDGVALYLRTLREDEQPGDLTWTEMGLHDSLKSLDVDLGGTADRVRYRPSDGWLRVTDFKYGKGVFVEVTENKQAMIYAVGAMLALTWPVKRTTVVIVQPRYEGVEPVREWEFANPHGFIDELLDRARATRLAAAPLVPGSHCKFCPAARTCSALAESQTAIMARSFATGSSPVAASDLAFALKQIEPLKARIKAVEQFAYTAALRGVDIPGFKIVEKRPVRRWKNEADVAEWAQTAGVAAYDRVLKSPAQLEEVISANAPRGEKRKAVSVLESFIESKSSGSVLVPVGDDRQPVVVYDAAKDFAGIPAAPALLDFTKGNA